MTDKTFDTAGIVTLDDRTKVRYSNDMVHTFKKLTKYGATRLDLVDLPRPMTKIEALNYIMTLPQFSSPEDQALIEDSIDDRERAIKYSKPAQLKPKMSLSDIASRPRTATVDDIIAAVSA